MNNKDRELLTVARHVVRYQVTCIAMFLSTGFVVQFVELEIWIALFMISLLVHSIYILLIFIVKENFCPNCNNRFFMKKDNSLNIGFGIYTKKCTNCGYKLKVNKKSE